MIRRLQPVLAVALAAALTAACSSGDDTSTTATTAPSTTVSSTIAGGDLPPTVEGDLLDPANIPTTIAPGGNGGEPAGLAPNEWGAPEPGGYQYRFNSEDEVLGVFDHDVDRRRDLSQTLIFQREKRRDAQLVRWLADGMWVESEQIQEAGNPPGPRCNWQPRYLEVPRPLEVGRQWTIESTCAEEERTRHRQGTARVTGSETITIAGASYEVFVIERSAETTLSNENGVPFATQRRQMTDRWAPSLGLLARSEGTVVITLEGVEQGTTPDRRELVDPTPVR